MIPGLGLEISEKGVLFATKQNPGGRILDVAIDLGERRVRARIALTRSGPMTRDGVAWILVAAALAASDDDAYRLLPVKVQERVGGVLVAAGRLAPAGDPKNPLLRMLYEGATRTGTHRLLVHSRRSDEGELLNFDSVLLVDDAGNVRLER